MSKKILTIFLSLFLVGIVSCSNKDKTDPKGIEQYNGNTYVSSQISIDNTPGYLWVSVKDGKVSLEPSEDANTIPKFGATIPYFPVTGYGTDYNFVTDAGSGVFEGTLKFSADASALTIRITKNEADPNGEMLNKDIVCNKK